MPKYSLDSVRIDGFRGLKNLRLDDLGRINILVGENNSGKTSILEALAILCNPLDPFEWVSMVRRRDFGGLDESHVQSLRWCFRRGGPPVKPDESTEEECTMWCDGGFPLRKLRVTYDELVGEPSLMGYLKAESLDRLFWQDGDAKDIEPTRGGRITHFVDWSEGEPPDGAASTQTGLLLFEGLPVRAKPRNPAMRLATETLTPYSYQINQVQVRSQSQLLFDQESLSSSLDLIREFDPDVREIKLASIRGVRPAIYLDHRRLGPAPLSIFGDGLRRAVLLAATLLVLKKGGVLLIDEVEAGIHVTALQRVFAWLTKAARDLEVQIVATTHSLEAVDGILLSNRDVVDDVVTFHLDQTEDETRAKRIYGDLLLRLRFERGLDVR
jgi:energy-coupling factor transporter ATP-binding protein EcfA2